MESDRQMIGALGKALLIWGLLGSLLSLVGTALSLKSIKFPYGTAADFMALGLIHGALLLCSFIFLAYANRED